MKKLFVAIRSGDLDEVKALIDAGADINFSDRRRPSAVDDIKESKLEAFELF